MKNYIQFIPSKSLSKYKICTLIFILLLIANCNAGKEKSIDDKKEICRNQAFLGYLASSERSLSGSYSFQYSCSANSGYSPSCMEYFSSTKKEDLCQIGYTKSKTKCSLQNLIGVCRYNPKDTAGQAVTVVFATPGDSLDQAKTFCFSSDINGIFTQTYLEPTATAANYDTTIINFFVCDEKAEKN